MCAPPSLLPLPPFPAAALALLLLLCSASISSFSLLLCASLCCSASRCTVHGSNVRVNIVEHVCVNLKCVRIHVQHSRNTKVFSAQGQNSWLQVNLANVVFYSYLAIIITLCVAGRDQHIRRNVSTVWSPVIHL